MLERAPPKLTRVQCDESGPPCRSCAALDIPCTFERPSRRRGPPNRHAEAVKRQRVQSPWEQVAPSSPPTVSTQGVRAPSSSDHVSAESICDIPTLQLLLDDYFIYIHPLVPVPHEPTFRAAFARREDLRDRTFLALVASMVGAFVASFPRIPLRRFKRVQNGQQLFSSSRTFLDRCHEITITARGLGYMDKSFTIYDAAISYLVGLIRAYTYDMKRCRVYFGECIMILRMLEVHKTNPTELAEYQRNVPKHLIQEDNVDSPGKVNYILRELGRRLFYLCVAGYGTIQQLGSTDGGVVMPPSTTTEPYPPLPVEVDDVYIFPSYIAPQPQGVISKLTGFNANVRVFCSYQSLSALEVAFGVDEHFGWERLKRVIGQCLRNVKAALDGVPPELVLQHVPPSKGNQNSQTQPQLNRHAEHWPSTDTASGHFSNDASNSNSALQYEIQKANIYASQLGTRSYLVEKYFNLCDVYGRHSSSPTSPDSISTPGFQAGGVDRDYLWSYPGQLPEVSCEAMAVERENIVKDLLVLLRTVDRVNMEPNGTSFVRLHSALFSQLQPTNRILTTFRLIRFVKLPRRCSLYRKFAWASSPPGLKRTLLRSSTF